MFTAENAVGGRPAGRTVAEGCEGAGARGGGRSGGFRTIVVFRRGARAFFVHGFAKSDRENLRRKELSGLRSLANEYLALDAVGLAAAQAVGTIIEVECDDQAV